MQQIKRTKQLEAQRNGVGLTWKANLQEWTVRLGTNRGRYRSWDGESPRRLPAPHL